MKSITIVIISFILVFSLCCQSKNEIIHIGVFPDEQFYKNTLENEINDYYMPGFKYYAKINNIDFIKIFNCLLINEDLINDSLSVYLSSGNYYESNDREVKIMIKSNTVFLYELLKVDINRKQYMLVLYNKKYPSELIDNFNINWNLAFLDNDYKLINEVYFSTKIKYQVEALWDMIITNIKIEKKRAVINITFIHVGGGDPRDQGFKFDFGINKNNKLYLIDGKQTVDYYNVEENEN